MLNLTRRLWQLARGDRLALAATVLFGFIAGLCIVWQAALVSRVVNDVFLDKKLLSAELGLFRILIFIVILRALFTWGNEASAGRLAVSLKSKLRRMLFESLLQAGPAYTRTRPAGDLAGSIFEGVEALGTYFSQYLPQVALAALVPLSILFFVFPRDLLSGAILLLTAPLIPLFMYLIGKGAEALTKRQWDTLRRLESYFLDSLQGLATLKIFGRSQERARSLADTGDRYRHVTLQVLRVTFLSALVLEMVATISTAMVAVEVSLRLLYGRLDFQQAFFLLLLAPEFYLPLRMLGIRFHAGMAGRTAASRIFELLDRKESVPVRRESPVESDISFSLLTFKDLCFTYPGETRPALENINLEIKKGEQVALVGLAGAGKTTLASLALGFIQPQQGQIRLDGIPLESIPLEAWRERLAWISQNPYLFNDTIAANLRLARPKATLEDLELAARAACLSDFIHSLPHGFDTVIGEAGARLSGGEAQRLALARAFLKDAPILILDEPTSNLDPANETLLVESTRRLMQGRTVITIAHRLNTFIHADRIYVLANGRLVESGAHPALLELKGAYSRLVNGTDPLLSSKAVPLERNDSLAMEQKNAIPDLQAFNSPISSTYPSSTHIFLRLLSFLNGSWKWVALSVLLGVLTVGSNVGLMGTAAYLISAAALRPAFGALQVAIVGVRFFGISRGVIRYTERLASHDVTFRLLSRLRAWFYRALEPLATARLMQYHSGDLLARIVADVDTLENFYVRAVSPPLVAAFVTAGMCFFLGHFDGRLAWAYLLFMVILGLFLPWVSGLSGRRVGEALVSQRADLQASQVDGINGLADILAFNHGREYSQLLAGREKAFGRSQVASASISGFFNGLVVLLVNTGMFTVLALSIPLVSSGRIFGPMLAALTLAALAGFEAILPLSPAAQALSSCSQAAKRLFEVVDAVPAVTDSPLVENVHSKVPEIQVSGLSFTYPGSPQPALEGIDLLVNPGKRIAIVGPSGSGKSTLASLLVRFWDYSQGKILLDGRDIRDFPQEEVRRQFSALPQKTAFFHETILQNLLLADPSSDESRVRQAAQKACIDDFINGLPKGYHTPLGERGHRFSAGERQRLALARAYLKDSPIFLLDEPTANLDPITEIAVLDTLFGSLAGRSLLLLTHRLVGLERMDEILVLDRGKIVERGTHSSLVAQPGLYRHLWDLQKGSFEAKMEQ